MECNLAQLTNQRLNWWFNWMAPISNSKSASIPSENVSFAITSIGWLCNSEIDWIFHPLPPLLPPFPFCVLCLSFISLLFSLLFFSELRFGFVRFGFVSSRVAHRGLSEQLPNFVISFRIDHRIASLGSIIAHLAHNYRLLTTIICHRNSGKPFDVHFCFQFIYCRDSSSKFLDSGRPRRRRGFLGFERREGANGFLGFEGRERGNGFLEFEGRERGNGFLEF